MADKKLDIEKAAAEKANDLVGDVMDGGVHRLSTDEKGTEILTSFELAELSNIDALTGVGNARGQELFFQEDERRQEAVKNVKERRGTGPIYTTFGVILYMDVDGLKEANYVSRKNGDKLLIRVADAAREVAERPDDRVFRQGGDGADEFAVVLPGSTQDDMDKIVAKFNAAMEGSGEEATASASLALGSYGNGQTMRELVAELDQLLGEAKKNRDIRGSHVGPIFLRQK